MDYTTEQKSYLIEKHGLYIDNIPPLLKAEKHWVNWRKEAGGKIPYQAHAELTGNLGRARINDPSTWATFDDALCGLLEHNMDGIGYAIGDINNNPLRIFLADQDHVVENGYATPIAQGIVMELRTYTEYSQVTYFNVR
jgi:primase-polymerase (primpol)-like protein